MVLNKSWLDKPGWEYLDTRYLKLSQTTPQTVIGVPEFQDGIKILTDGYLYFRDADQFIRSTNTGLLSLTAATEIQLQNNEDTILAIKSSGVDLYGNLTLLTNGGGIYFYNGTDYTTPYIYNDSYNLHIGATAATVYFHSPGGYFDFTDADEATFNTISNQSEGMYIYFGSGTTGLFEFTSPDRIQLTATNNIYLNSPWVILQASGYIYDAGAINYLTLGDGTSSYETTLYSEGALLFSTGSTAGLTATGNINLTGALINLESPTIIDVTSTEALLVRANLDTGDVFTVDTANSCVGVNVDPDTDYQFEVGGTTKMRALKVSRALSTRVVGIANTFGDNLSWSGAGGGSITYRGVDFSPTIGYTVTGTGSVLNDLSQATRFNVGYSVTDNGTGSLGSSVFVCRAIDSFCGFAGNFNNQNRNLSLTFQNNYQTPSITSTINIGTKTATVKVYSNDVYFTGSPVVTSGTLNIDFSAYRATGAIPNVGTVAGAIFYNAATAASGTIFSYQNNTTMHNLMGLDASKTAFGTGGIVDSYLSWDGTNLDVFSYAAIDFMTNADTNLVFNFIGTTNSGVLTWMENEDQFKFTDRVQTDGGIIGKITTVTDTYTVLVSDETVICNKATNFTVTLPAATVGQKFMIKNINTGVVTVDANSTDLIDGSLTQSVNQWESIQLQCYIANNWGVL